MIVCLGMIRLRKPDSTSAPSRLDHRRLRRELLLHQHLGPGHVFRRPVGDHQPQMPPGHPATQNKAAVDLTGISKPHGGLTVAEVYAGKKDLAGKEVVLRGKVVKFLAEIMGKNWIHVQDGSGSQGTNDLTVTVAPHIVAKVGDTVLVKGLVTVGKDFGYGYKYDVILEDAQVTVE